MKLEASDLELLSRVVAAHGAELKSQMPVLWPYICDMLMTGETPAWRDDWGAPGSVIAECSARGVEYGGVVTREEARDNFPLAYCFALLKNLDGTRGRLANKLRRLLT